MFNIVKCETYDDKEIAAQLDKLVDLSKYANKGEKILVKPNLLEGNSPDQVVTTHPAVVKAVVKKLQEIGATVIIADSPQYAFTQSRLKKVYEKTGMQSVSDETGCELNYNTDSYSVASNSGIIKKLSLISALQDVDKVINLCKVKTHIMTKFTCATKNLYGLIPGMTKTKLHMHMDMGQFAKIIVDVAEHVKPTLTIVDGIVGMEGQGPAGGEAK